MGCELQLEVATGGCDLVLRYVLYIVVAEVGVGQTLCGGRHAM